MSFFDNLFLKKVNGVSDTETLINIGLWRMDETEFMDIITQRTKGNLKQYFLFDFLKIWQQKIK